MAMRKKHLRTAAKRRRKLINHTSPKAMARKTARKRKALKRD